MSHDELPPCACGRAHFPRREAQGFSPFEQVVLDLSRHILDVHANQNGKSWIKAVEIAEHTTGTGDGPLLVARVTALIRAFISERSECFHYLSPCCLHVTEHEIALIKAVQRARSGDWAALTTAVQDLVRADAYPRTLQAAVALAGPLVSAQDARWNSAKSAAMPALPVVVH